MINAPMESQTWLDTGPRTASLGAFLYSNGEDENREIPTFIRTMTMTRCTCIPIAVVSAIASSSYSRNKNSH